MYWGDFGWLDTPIPRSLAAVLVWTSLLAVGLTLAKTLRGVFSRTEEDPGRATRGRLVPGSLDPLGDRLLRPARRADGISPPGRYFLPPIIAQMAWLAIGLVSLAPARCALAALVFAPIFRGLDFFRSTSEAHVGYFYLPADAALAIGALAGLSLRPLAYVVGARPRGHGGARVAVSEDAEPRGVSARRGGCHAGDALGWVGGSRSAGRRG